MISSRVSATRRANYVENVAFALARERLPRIRQLIFASFLNVAEGLPPVLVVRRIGQKAASSSRLTLERARSNAFIVTEPAAGSLLNRLIALAAAR
jgi:hypothetical protein